MKNLIEFKQPEEKERNLFFSDQVDQKTIGSVIKEIVEINELDDYYEKYFSLNNLKYERKPIKIWIDSYGGNIYQCFGLLSVIETSKTPIHTIVTGAAMSAGFMILIHGHRRFAYELSTPLYHQVSTGFYGTIKSAEERMEEVKKKQKIMEKQVMKKTNITKKQLKKIYTRKIDWFMKPKEALELGVIDEIIK